jgi:hypothetical protein
MKNMLNGAEALQIVQGGFIVSLEKYSIAGCVARGNDALFIRLCGETA